MQCVTSHLQFRPSSWFIPRLWPSSWATMEENDITLLLVNWGENAHIYIQRQRFKYWWKSLFSRHWLTVCVSIRSIWEVDQRHHTALIPPPWLLEQTVPTKAMPAVPPNPFFLWKERERESDIIHIIIHRTINLKWTHNWIFLDLLKIYFTMQRLSLFGTNHLQRATSTKSNLEVFRLAWKESVSG